MLLPQTYVDAERHLLKGLSVFVGSAGLKEGRKVSCAAISICEIRVELSDPRVWVRPSVARRSPQRSLFVPRKEID